jgi:hypothetical protein
MRRHSASNFARIEPQFLPDRSDGEDRNRLASKFLHASSIPPPRRDQVKTVIQSGQNIRQYGDWQSMPETILTHWRKTMTQPQQNPAAPVKHAKLKKFVDVASVICVAYFFLCPIWAQYSPAPRRLPGEPMDILDKLMFIDLLPAAFGAIWLLKNMVFAPPGTYPLWDKMHKKEGGITAIGFLVFGGGLVLWILLNKLATFLGRM